MSGNVFGQSALPSRDFPLDGWTRAASCGPNGGNCVEVNLASTGIVGVRDSKPAFSPVLRFDGSSWRAFLDRTGANH